MNVKLEISKKDIFTLVLIAIFFPPSIIYKLSSVIGTFFTYAQVGIAVIMIIAIANRNQRYIKKGHIAWIIFCIWGLVVTIIFQKAMIYAYIKNIVLNIVYAIIIYMFYQPYDWKIDRFFKVISKYWVFLIILNLFMMFLYPKGIIQSDIGATHERANWLFGSKNNITSRAILGCAFFCFDYVRTSSNLGKNRKRIKKYIYIMLYMITFMEVACSGSNEATFMGGSSTGIISVAMFGMMICIITLKPFKKILKWLTPTKIALIFFVIDIVFVYGTVYSIKIKIISDLFALFGKDTTISGRSKVWYIILPTIFNKPVIGNGYFNTEIIGNLTSTYNEFLDILLHYGLIGFGIFIVVCHFYSKEGNKSKDIKTETLISAISLICVFICGTVNTFSWLYMVILLELYASEKSVINQNEYRKKIRKW